MLEELGYIEKSYDPLHKYISIQGQKYWTTNDKEMGKGWIFNDHYPDGPYDSDPVYQILDNERQKQIDILDYLRENLDLRLSVSPKNMKQLLVKVDMSIGGEKIASEVKVVTENALGQWKTT